MASERLHQILIIRRQDRYEDYEDRRSEFDSALLHGVVSMDGDAYHVLTPSMKQWLLSQYYSARIHDSNPIEQTRNKKRQRLSRRYTRHTLPTKKDVP